MPCMAAASCARPPTASASSWAGDDGKLVSLDAQSTIETLATDAKRRWIDNVALHSDGAVAWSAGKTAYVKAPKGEEKSLDVPSTVGGLAFAPKGVRLAVAHYNGVTLWFPTWARSRVSGMERLDLGVTFSADQPHFLSPRCMSRAARLAAGRFASHADDRVSGTGAFDVLERGREIPRHLGLGQRDPVAVCQQGWPDGKEPGMLAPLQAKATVVACHPRDDVFAVGYSDGTILMVRIEDGAEILVRGNAGEPVAALAWNGKGIAARLCRRRR